MTGPTWYVNATAYGHADLMDPVYVELNEVIIGDSHLSALSEYKFCLFFLLFAQLIKQPQLAQFCPNDPNAPKPEYIQFLTGEIVSFINAVLDPVGNCALFDNLEKSGLVGINTLNDFASNGWDRCTPSECVLTPSSYSMFSFW